MMAKTPVIGTHLATLNLFRERDGAVEITVADSRGAIAEWDSGKAASEMNLPDQARPLDYVEELIVEAAHNMETRRGR